VNKLTTKNIYSQIVKEIEKRVSYNTKSSYNNQTSRTGTLGFSNASNATTAEIISGVQNLLEETLPSTIINGLEVVETSPISSSVNISSGKGAVGGVLYELTENLTLQIPFDNTCSVFYIVLYRDMVMVEKTYDAKKLTMAKIIVPQPGTTSLIQDNKDSSWNAYIVNFKEYKLYGYNNRFEEDTIELLRDNISPILADNLIGNIRLSENLKIINTQGTLELDSSELRLLSTNDTTLAKFNRNGTFFYDDNGIEIARFTTDDAKIGNILVTKNSIGSGNFVSESRGFRIEDGGYAEFENVRIRGIISSSVFEYDQISAVGGKVYIGNASVLALDVSASDTTITVEEAVFSLNEVLTIKSGINQEWMLVTNVSNAPTYTVTRDISNSYTTNPTWTEGTAIVSSGTTNNGFISLDAVSNYAPFIDINLRNSTTYNDWTTKVRLGNLAGITDDLYGTLSGYGLYSDNVYLRGKLYAPDIKTAITGRRIELSDEGLFLYDDSSTRKFSVFLESVSGSADTGDVIIGDMGSENYIKWDESIHSLIVRGDILADSVSLGDRNYVTTIVFSNVDYNTVEWTSGNIEFSDGTTKTIVAGNTGDVGNITYIYYDDAVSQTVLQTSTTYSDSVGSGKVLLAMCDPGESSSVAPIISIGRGFGTTIDASGIVTGYINSARIQADSISADKLNVTQLDAIAINTGSLTIDEAINVGSGGKVVLDGSNKIIKVYDDSGNLRVELGLLS
jgi:hypothetical protein